MGRMGYLCFLLAGLVLLSGPGRGMAQKEEAKGHGSHKEKGPIKVEVSYYLGNKEQVKSFDLSKQKDREEFHKILEEEHVHHLRLENPPKLMDIVFELSLWTIVVFLLLYFILKKAAWGPILQGLKKREDDIREAAQEAKKAREETKRVTAEYQAKMDQAYAEIPKLLDQARKDAQNLAEEMRAKAQADIQAERQRLLREIDMTKDQALQEITQYTANLATLISAKAIQRSLSLEDHQALVEESIGELRKAEK
jgi:F-type H+-transporting ATPase subunit b